MSVDQDTPIKFTNKTGSSDFSVVVFTANGTEETSSRLASISVAYRVIRAQNTAHFVHPKACEVSATYTMNGQLTIAGPIPAIPGGKYEIIKELETDTAIIREVAHPYTLNPGGAITIKNVRPKAWKGQLFNCILSKNGCTLLEQPDIHSDNHAVFILKPILKFAVTRNVEIGKTFFTMEVSSIFTVDLQTFPNGVEIILEEDPGGLAYDFSAVCLLSSSD